MTNNTKNENTTSGYPDFRVYHVPEGKNAFWTRIGAAWYHKDNEGLNIELDLIPYGAKGRIVLRKFELEKERNSEEADKK